MKRLFQALSEGRLYEPEIEASLPAYFYRRQDLVVSHIVNVLTRHGALSVESAQVVPQTRAVMLGEDTSDMFMSPEGDIYCQPFNPCVAHARWISRPFNREISTLKTYRFQTALRKGTRTPNRIGETMLCMFDIMTPTRNNVAPDCELIMCLLEMLRDLKIRKEVGEGSFVLRLSHTVIMEAITSACGITEDQKKDFITALTQRKGKGTWANETKAKLAQIGIPGNQSDSITELFRNACELRGDIDKFMNKVLNKVQQAGNRVTAAFEAFKELKRLLAVVRLLNVASCTIVIDFRVPYDYTLYDGLIFELCCAEKKATLGPVVASGGRYDSLCQKYQQLLQPQPQVLTNMYQKKPVQPPKVTACGAKLDISLLTSCVKPEVFHKRAYNQPRALGPVIVHSATGKDAPDKYMKWSVAHELWDANFCADVWYDQTATLNDVTEYCTAQNIPLLAFMSKADDSIEIQLQSTFGVDNSWNPKRRNWYANLDTLIPRVHNFFVSLRNVVYHEEGSIEDIPTDLDDVEVNATVRFPTTSPKTEGTPTKKDAPAMHLIGEIRDCRSADAQRDNSEKRFKKFVYENSKQLGPFATVPGAQVGIVNLVTAKLHTALASFYGHEAKKGKTELDSVVEWLEKMEKNGHSNVWLYSPADDNFELVLMWNRKQAGHSNFHAWGGNRPKGGRAKKKEKNATRGNFKHHDGAVW
eukprot:TRINITY_DN52990_c0_g1_i2.p1 TRINITY_DN52990_c0_g1~~TRINITY_DN52990_c0_g1_i2.p1  ORF type:complete len:699 (+),score=51.73 TRINITY_DN52990_c0_g1_i2:1-2097(+)